jgi:hypothetical protein
MKATPAIMITLFLLSSCQNKANDNLFVAGRFIDAFYSFDRDSLDAILAEAPGSKPEILYYQKWAGCAH